MLEPVDDVPDLTDEEEAGIHAAIESVSAGKGVSVEAAKTRIGRILICARMISIVWDERAGCKALGGAWVRRLGWSDVDFALRRIHIRQSAPKWLDEEKAPKSNRQRWVDLTPATGDPMLARELGAMGLF